MINNASHTANFWGSVAQHPNIKDAYKNREALDFKAIAPAPVTKDAMMMAPRKSSE